MNCNLSRAFAVAAVTLAFSGRTSAQCLQWDPSYNIGYGYSSSVAALLATVDLGSGPALYSSVDGLVFRRSGPSWVFVGEAFDDGVAAVCGYDDGSGTALYAGGRFLHLYSGAPIRGVAKLVGSTWQLVGSGLPVVGDNNAVYALHSFDDGGGKQLYVGGWFLTGSPFLSDSLLRWNGTTWSEVGRGIAWDASGGGSVYAMCEYDDGTGPALYVAGAFHFAGGLPANNIAKWDGTRWSALGSGLEVALSSTYPIVGTLAVFDDGSGPSLFAGGNFQTAGGVTANGLAKWNGTSWSAVPGFDFAASGGVSALAVHADGAGPALYVSAAFGPAPRPLRWDGTTWSTMGAGIEGRITSMLSFDDGLGAGPALVVAGNFVRVGGNLTCNEVARWPSCTQPIDAMCPGDGSFAACPCANYGWSQHGCWNSSVAGGAFLSHSGTTSPDTLHFVCSYEPVSSRSMFLQSAVFRTSGAFLGDGLLCLGAPIRRLYYEIAPGGSATAPAPGEPSISQRSAALGDPLTPGSVRYYQVLYRDSSYYCTLATFNISNGLRVVW